MMILSHLHIWDGIGIGKFRTIMSCPIANPIDMVLV